MLVYLSSISVEAPTYTKHPAIKYTPSAIDTADPFPTAFEIVEAVFAPSVFVPPPTIPNFGVSALELNTSPTPNFSTVERLLVGPPDFWYLIYRVSASDPAAATTSRTKAVT